jgi:hypothetical protein
MQKIKNAHKCALTQKYMVAEIDEFTATYGDEPSSTKE